MTDKITVVISILFVFVFLNTYMIMSCKKEGFSIQNDLLRPFSTKFNRGFQKSMKYIGLRKDDETEKPRQTDHSKHSKHSAPEQSEQSEQSEQYPPEQVERDMNRYMGVDRSGLAKPQTITKSPSVVPIQPREQFKGKSKKKMHEYSKDEMNKMMKESLRGGSPRIQRNYQKQIQQSALEDTVSKNHYETIQKLDTTTRPQEKLSEMSHTIYTNPKSGLRASTSSKIRIDENARSVPGINLADDNSPSYYKFTTS